MKFLIGSLLVVAVIGSVALYHRSTPSKLLLEYELEEVEFNSFIKNFNKNYETEEEYQNRFRIFRNNLAYIRVFNSFGNSWTLGVNELADLTGDEFRHYYTSLLHRDTERPVSAFEDKDVPQTVDWRSDGAVTPVKNQGQCGSCWAFSTTGSVEGAWFISSKNLVSLSEQQLVSCSGSYGNYGCNGGLMDNAFQYIMANGITSEATYPYTARTGVCNKSLASQTVAKISNYKDVTPQSASALEAAIAQQPVSVAVEADQAAWQLYSGGVVSSNCGTNLDHGVLAVGYNLGANPPYYIVKNSWGASWGMAGYIQIAITGDGPGVCGIQLEPSYPIV